MDSSGLACPTFAATDNALGPLLDPTVVSGQARAVTPTEPPARADVGDLYRTSRLRTQELLAGLEPAQWELPVPACPGWRVRDVLGHLVGAIEDAAAGRISGPPAPEMTAIEVERHALDDPVQLLHLWDRMAPPFEDKLTEGGIWPGFFDVLSHEHDVHGALGSRGEQDGDEVLLAAKLLVRGADLGRPFQVDTGERVLTSAVDGDDPLVLRAAAFDVFRLRLGRRSRAQVLTMDWSEPPGDVVDRLFVFGPAEHDLVE